MLPFLPSVMANAQNAGYGKRFVQVFTPFGQMPDRFWPADQGLQTVDGIAVKQLSTINGDISQVLGPAWSPLKPKISVVRGLHVLAGSGLHNGSYGSCGSGTYTDNLHNGPPVFPWSVDAVLAQSDKIYPDATGKQRFVNIAPTGGAYSNFSWWRNNGRIEHLPVTNSTDALFAKFTQLGNGASPAQDPRRVRQLSVMDEIFEQYKALRDGNKISAQCKERLEAYTTTISELDKGLREVNQASCERPDQENENNNEAARHRNQIRIIVAALACGLTNVVSYSISLGYEPMHSWAHEYNVNSHAGRQRQVGEWIAYLISEMDKMPDLQGTLLDNSLVYWGNEYGDQLPGDAHTNTNMPVVLAGGAGGKMRTGYLVDYRKSGGRPINNLLVTFLNAMGLTPAEYERENVVGFGEYNQGAIDRFNFGGYVGNAQRRQPLPFLYL